MARDDGTDAKESKEPGLDRLAENVDQAEQELQLAERRFRDVQSRGPSLRQLSDRPADAQNEHASDMRGAANRQDLVDQARRRLETCREELRRRLRNSRLLAFTLLVLSGGMYVLLRLESQAGWPPLEWEEKAGWKYVYNGALGILVTSTVLYSFRSEIRGSLPIRFPSVTLPLLLGWVSFSTFVFGYFSRGAVSLKWAHFTENPTMDRLMEFYAWSAVDMIPVLEVWKTLDISSPLEPTNVFARILLVLFRLLILIPFGTVFVAWFRASRQRSASKPYPESQSAEQAVPPS